MSSDPLTNAHWPLADRLARARSRRRRSCAEVLDDHLRLAAERRVEEDLDRNYARDCVLLDRRGAFHGHEGARTLARLLHEELGDAPFDYVTRVVEGRVGFLEWTAEGERAVVRDGADSFVVEEGLVVAQTIHYTVEPRR